VSTRWARTALSRLAVAVPVLFVTVVALTTSANTAAAATSAQAHSGPKAAAQRVVTDTPLLTLASQSPWVTAAQPWFNLTFGVAPSAGSAAGLHVSLTYYGRTDSGSQLQQAINGSASGSELLRQSDVPVTVGTGGMTASTCVTVVPDASVTPPTTGPGVCAPGDPTLVLGCTPLTGRCGDVYPVTVALERQGSASPLERFTTFLTYQEPTAIGEGGKLSVGVVVPVGANGTTTLATALSDYRDVPTTLAVSPAAVAGIEETHSRSGLRALEQLATLDAEEVLGAPYVSVNVAALPAAGIAGEISAQVSRGDELLHTVGLRPTGGTWLDTTSSFSQGDAGDLAAGLHEAGASQLVLSDNDLGSGGESNYTFAQPFTLDLGHGTSVTAVASDSTLSARFTADPADPVLEAEQLLAGLSFVHFENAFLPEPRGVVITPAPGWRPSGPFMETLLAGLSDNPALKAVTLSQLFSTVPVGGNHEPDSRTLQSGPAGHGISHTAADKIAVARQQLSSFAKATVVDGAPAPPELTTLSDLLLATEAKGLSPAGRTAALDAYQRAFAGETGKISLATEQTVTFTAQQASIPITVLSAASYPVQVVVTLTSDKFTFPDGNTRPLLLDRPTTSVRVTAQARTSGDRLPIEVTLHTPNGQLLLAHTVLTVHSTAISFVGVALTVLAGAVLLVWWARTWRRSRRQRPRAH
jgi:Family of unknown function (DUF6049)